MPDSLFKAATPTVLVDSKEMPDIGLLSLSISEHQNGLFRCEATVGNWGTRNGKNDFLYFDRKKLDFGKPFQIKLQSDTLFDGRITALEAHFLEARSPEMTVLAEDRFQDLRMTRRTRTFQDMTDGDVIRQVSTDHGLTPDVNLKGPNYKVLAQTNQSDLAFIRERARAVDGELWMEGSTLHAKAHADRNNGTLDLSYGKELRAFTVSADLAGQSTAVSVNGWDVSSKSGLTYQATDSTLNGELNGDASGASILQTAFGARKQALAHTVPLNRQEAQAEAETFFKRTARRFVTARGLADTNSKLRVGTYVNLSGLGPLFSGKYYVAEAHHLFDLKMGIRTEFTAERPGLGRAQ